MEQVCFQRVVMDNRKWLSESQWCSVNCVTVTSVSFETTSQYAGELERNEE
jgi:hypothetical protein